MVRKEFGSPDKEYRVALFSECGTFRYKLFIGWNMLLPSICFIMLNPSTADESKNDPTVERCEQRARAWGFGSCIILNAFAMRSTAPKRLREVEDPGGPENLETIYRHFDLISQIYGPGKTQAKVVVAWGNDWMVRNTAQAERIRIAAKSRGIPLYCLGTNQNGTPKHPLYQPYNAELVPWPKEEK